MSFSFGVGAGATADAAAAATAADNDAIIPPSMRNHYSIKAVARDAIEKAKQQMDDLSKPTRRGFGEREPSPPSAETVASSLRDALVAAEETGLLDSETSDEAKQLLSDIPSIVAKKVATKPLNEAIQNVREGSRHRGRGTLCLEGLIQEVSSAEGVAESAVLEEAKPCQGGGEQSTV